MAQSPGRDLISDLDRYQAKLKAAGVDVREVLAVDDLDHSRCREVGRFSVQQRLGQGGCGTVYLAYDDQLQRRVAIKVPRSSLAAQSDFRRRFMLEARAMAKLSHPHIVPVYEVGGANDEAAPCYIVTEYCAGPSLAEFLADCDDSRLDPQIAADLVAKLAAALHHVHQSGVVHRDIKPSNVLLFPQRDVDGENAFPFHPKLTDFGLAKEVSEVDRQSVSTGPVGTAQYMAPEQVTNRKESIGPATDVYGLGVLLYQILCGQVPFESVVPLEVYMSIVNDHPPSLPDYVPKELSRICMKCLQKVPSDRYGSTKQLQIDLCNFLNGQPLQHTTTKNSRYVFNVIAAVCAVPVAATCGFIWIKRDTLTDEPIDSRNLTVAESSEVPSERYLWDNSAFRAQLDDLLTNGDESALASLEAVVRDYPIEWRHNPETGALHGYKLIPYRFPLSWQEAADLAATTRARGVAGKLATVTSNGEHELIVEQLAQVTGVPLVGFKVWIGLVHSPDQGRWQWVDGTTSRFESWHPNEPASRGEEAAATYELRRGNNGVARWGWAANRMESRSVSYALVEYEISEEQ